MTATAPTGLAWAPISAVDPELWAAMIGERRRQHDKVELIASENYVYAAVLEAQGSWLTNKYAEGLPGKRYYGGCEFVDVAERLAQERALELFPGAEHVNVQPHSGAQANMAAYLSTVSPGDRVLGMKLDQGGHLTHGMALNFSGRYFEIHGYGVSRDDERIDYDALEQQAKEVRPKLIIGGASAYPRIIDFVRMADIAHSVGALLWVDMAHIAGLVAAGLHPSPFPHADIVTTTTHKTLRGARGGLIFGRRELPPTADPADYPMVKPNLARNDRPERLPGRPGRPARARHRGQGRRLQARADRRVPRVPAPGPGQCPGDGRDPDRRGHAADLGRHRQPPHPGRRDLFGVTGKEAEHLLDEIGITVNKNGIPFDPNPPNTSSGIRIGTPATTSRGFGEDEMRDVGRIIVEAIRRRDEPAAQARLAAEVAAIVARFPVPGLTEV